MDIILIFYTFIQNRSQSRVIILLSKVINHRVIREKCFQVFVVG
jgi:hypothetical protein